MLLADWEIEERMGRSSDDPRHMRISPYSPGEKNRNEVSFGLSSYGYDLRVGGKYLCFPLEPGFVLDPLTLRGELEDRLRRGDLHYFEGDHFVIPANSFVLAESVERFRIPRDVLGVILGKSTYARTGITMTCTPLEPEWEGIVTLEIANLTQLPARIHSFQGVGQVLFHSGSLCRKSYADKADASYQNQMGLTLPTIRT